MGCSSCGADSVVACSLIALLLSLCAVRPSQAAGMDQVESRPVDGFQFTEGQTFRFICKAVGNQDFAVRLLCPLSDFAPPSLSSTACYENCGIPLCNYPALNDCDKNMPELLRSNCTRRISQLTGDVQEITLEYSFRQASVRSRGSYICHYKNMRSGVIIQVDATTTTSTTSTTATTTTTSTTTASTLPTTTTASTTSTARTTTTTTDRPEKAPVTAGTAAITAAGTTSRDRIHAVTSQPAPHGPNVDAPVKTSNGNASPAPASGEGNSGSSTDAASGDADVQLKSGWFYSSLVGKLVGIDIVLIVLLIVLGIVLIGGFLFIRCQVSARQRADTSTKRPLKSCCAALLCIRNSGGGGGRDGGGSGGGGGGSAGGAKAKLNGHSSKLRSSERPTLHAFPSGGGGSDAASSVQVYAEANLDSSYYSQGETDRLPGGAGGDAYYRLQTHFNEADPRLLAGGSQRGPRVGFSGVAGAGGVGSGAGGFFSRDAQDRHSFHNVRAARQRPAIPTDLMLRAGGGGDGGGGGGGGGAAEEPGRERIREQVEQQRREIELLRQQLRDSQLQLTRLASSQQDLHRSVSFSRMAAARGPATAATTPDEPASVGTGGNAAVDDYELLSKTTTPTAELPGFATGGDAVCGVGGGLRASADLLLSIDEPIEEEDDDQVEYPTVRSKRRSSIGEAYAAGRMCPA